jgi:hypothetical protein
VKKYLVVALAAMFVLGFAASSFAIHAEIPAETQAVVSKGATQITIGGEVRVRGLIDNNTKDFNSDATNPGDDAKWDQRVRLQVEAKVTPNTTGLIQLEAGDKNTTDITNWGSSSGGAKGTIPLGDSKQNEMRVLQAWILHTGSGLLGVPALIKIGHMPVQINQLAYSHTKFGDDALLLGVDPVKELHIILGTVKLVEGATEKSDDANGYTLIASYDINKDSAVGFNATYADAQNGSLLGGGVDAHLWNFSINGKTRVGGLGISGELDVQTGKVEDIPGIHDQGFRGWAGKLDFDYAINPVTLMFGAAYGSGPDINKVDNKIHTFVTTMDAIQHFTFVYEYLTPNAAGNTNGGLQNTWFLKLGAKADLMKDLDGMLNIYYLRAAKKVSNTFDSKSIGTEVDMNLNYKIDRNLKYFVEGGYLFAGNFWKNVTGTHSVDDAWALRHGIQLTF